jgi:hypothetical protein
MGDQRYPKANAVLGRQAACGDVLRMAGEKSFPAADDGLETSAILEMIFFVAEVRAQTGLLSVSRPRDHQARN